jgi:magnesium transporter
MYKGAPQLLYELMDAVLDAYFPVLEKLDDKIDEFEDRLYRGQQSDEGEQQPLSGEIFALKRVLLEIRHITGPTRDVVNILLRRDAEQGGRNFAAFQDLYDHASRIVSTIDTYREILSGALDAYLAIESNNMNAIMKRLTAYSIILLVPTLIAGVYGMNFDDLPKEHGFYGSLAAMGSVIVGLGVYFKRRGWL